MLLIRRVAVTTLFLIAALAFLLVLPGDTPYFDRAGQALALLFAALNAAAVARVARGRSTRMEVFGLGMVLGAVAMALMLETADYWYDLLLPSDGSLFGMMERLGQAMVIVETLLWAGTMAFVLGWGCWSLSRLAPRRTVRVVSRP